MALRELHEQTIAGVKRVKEYACRNRPRDIPAMIDVYRGEVLVATIRPPMKTTGDMIAAIATAASGFEGDAMIIAAESFSPTLAPNMELLSDDELAEVSRKNEINPVTGRPWAYGEMAEVARLHDGIAMGWVTELILFSSVNRAGDLIATHQPFRYVAGKYLSWGTPWTRTDQQIDGDVPAAMVAAMNAPSAGHLFPFDPTELTQAQRDVVVAQILVENGSQVGLFAGTEEQDRVRVLRSAGIQL